MSRSQHRRRYIEKGLTEEEEQILWSIKEAKAAAIPSPAVIVKRAVSTVLATNAGNAGYVKTNFSRLISDIEAEAHHIYRGEELAASSSALVDRFRHSTRTVESVEGALVSIFHDNYSVINEYFLSLRQSRASRAGAAFENIVSTLFDLVDVPYDSQPVINGKPDFLLPSEAHYKSNAMDCIVFTLKRTLKERWRQITTEGAKGLGFFLGTIDTEKNKSELAEMLDNRINLVVPADIKHAVAAYRPASNVITFEEFFRDHIDPAIQRWSNKGVL